MESKQKKILVGCALGCLIPIILLVTTCVGFTSWLRAEGELLEPQQLLDEQAVGYIEWRMELDNPGTERFFEAAVELMDTQGRRGMPDFPLFDLFHAWNQRRQTRELRRFFPATGSWLLYPHGFVSKGVTEDSDPARLGQLYSFSAARAANQIRLMDWVGGWFLPRALGERARVYRGERIYEFGDPDEIEGDEPIRTDQESEARLGGEVVTVPGGLVHSPEPFSLHVFLRGEGVFAATEQAVAYRAIDHLAEERAPAAQARRPTRLERLFASVPEGSQMRGAILSDNGELAEIVDVLFVEWFGAGNQEETTDRKQTEELALDPELLADLRASHSLAFGAGILADGGADFDLIIDGPEALAEGLQELGRRLTETLAERDLALSSDVSLTPEGVRWQLHAEDLVGSLERNVDRAVSGAMSELQSQVEQDVREKVEQEERRREELEKGSETVVEEDAR